MTQQRVRMLRSFEQPCLEQPCLEQPSSPPAVASQQPKAYPNLPARMMIELLRSGQSVRFVAHGASMWPSIPPGSRLEVQPCRAMELKVGEVAAFECEGQLVVHRVTRVTAAAVRLQGDNTDGGDGDVPAEQVLGRATVLERRHLHWRWPRRGELRRAARALLRRLAPRLSR